MVWADFSSGGSTAGDIQAASISGAGAVGPRGVVSLAAPNQPMSRIAAGGSGYLTVYVSETATEARILAQRLDASGRALDLTPLILASGSTALTNPGVAWNGSEFLVVWDDTSANAGRGQVYAKRDPGGWHGDRCFSDRGHARLASGGGGIGRHLSRGER